MSGGRFNLSDYVTVDERIDRFWEKYPHGAIRTEMIYVNNDGSNVAIRASVYKDREALHSNPDATGIAQELQGGANANKSSWWENCETSAIGRALANLGMSISKQRPSREEMAKVQRYEDDDGNAASKPAPAKQLTGEQRYNHARQHGKDPLTNDAPQWGDIEDAIRRESKPPPSRANAPLASPQPRTATEAPAVVSQAAMPAPRLLTDAEFKRLMEQAWTLVEDGKTYIDVVAFVKRSRDRMTEAQYDQSRDEVRLIRKAIETRDQETPKPAAFAG